MKGARRLERKRLFRRLVEVLRAFLSILSEPWTATEETIPVAVFVTTPSHRPLARVRPLPAVARVVGLPSRPLRGAVERLRRWACPSDDLLS